MADEIELPDIDVDSMGADSWKSVLDSVINYDMTTGYDADTGSFNSGTRDLVASSKEILDSLFSSTIGTTVESVTNDIAKTSSDLADSARTGNTGILSDIMKSVKNAYGGMDDEGKKFMFSALTGIMNYDNVKKTREAQTKIAEAAMLNAQTNASTLQNKISLQGSTGKMNFQPRSGRGLIYQNIPEQKGL